VLLLRSYYSSDYVDSKSNASAAAVRGGGGARGSSVRSAMVIAMQPNKASLKLRQERHVDPWTALS